MRLLDIAVISTVLCVFSSVISGSIKNIREIDLRIEEVHKKNDCIRFISESFCKTCNGGEKRCFENLAEWSKCCRAMWSLDDLEWRVESVSEDEILYYAEWSGLYGNGLVYCRKRKLTEE